MQHPLAAWLSSPLWNLLSFAVGLWLGHALALRRDRLGRRERARQTFIDALLPAVRLLDTGADTFDPLGPLHEGHALAVLRLTLVLPPRQRRTLHQQWQRYEQWYRSRYCPHIPPPPALQRRAAHHLRALLAAAG